MGEGVGREGMIGIGGMRMNRRDRRDDSKMKGEDD